MTASPFAGCTTLAEFYRQLIHAENILSPVELTAIWENDPFLSPELRGKLGETIAMVRQGHAEPREFSRVELSPDAQLYRSEGGGAKELLVCFAGVAYRLMLPVAAFLQFIPEDRFDVLVLRDVSHALYLRGVAGLGGDLPSSFQALFAWAARSGYRRIRCFGTSAGGAPALYAALSLDAVIGVAIGGHHPTACAEQTNFPDGCSGEELDDAVPAARASSADCALILALGGGFEPDRRGAETLRQRLPHALLLPEPACDSHNLLVWLLRQGRLQQFLDQTILAER